MESHVYAKIFLWLSLEHFSTLSLSNYKNKKDSVEW